MNVKADENRVQTHLRRTAKSSSRGLSLKIVLPLIQLARLQNSSNRFWAIFSHKIISKFIIQIEKLPFFICYWDDFFTKNFHPRKNIIELKGFVHYGQVFSFEKFSLAKPRIGMVVCHGKNMHRRKASMLFRAFHILVFTWNLLVSSGNL